MSVERPYPPEALQDRETEQFRPAPEVAAWLRGTFIIPDAPLFNDEHGHLEQATFGVLWTNCRNRKGGMVIAGTAEMPNVSGDRWCKARSRVQFLHWFDEVPDFVITLDAVLATEATDTQFCALVEHEVYHCGIELDRWGCKKYDRYGAPVFGMRGHDVEEFVGIVRRYGSLGVLNPKVHELVQAAGAAPQVETAKVRLACGTCLRMAA